MAAPTYTWAAIADTQTDTASPLDTTLMDAIRKNFVHLEEWLGDSYTAAKNHDHDGVNSAYTNQSVNVVRTWDDFLTVSVSDWTQVGAGTVGAAVPGKNGLCRSIAPASAYGGIFQSNRPWILSGPTITYETTVKHTGGSAYAFIGLSEDTTFNNSVAFRRENGANWLCYTTNGGTSTTTDSGIAFATGAFKTFKIIATPTSVTFYIDGSLEATHTTNIPTTAQMGIIALNYDSGSTAHIDYVHCYTTTRM